MSRAPLLAAIALGAPLIFWLAPLSPPAEAEDPADQSATQTGDAQASDDSEAGDAEPGDQPEGIWANAACYVCHMSFVKEELSKVHLEAKVTCIKCHGLSAAHANDEDIGATPPDVVFKRCRVDAMCLECHKTHDVPARKVLARFLQRRLKPKPSPTCTDCHGTHKIEQPANDKHG